MTTTEKHAYLIIAHNEPDVLSVLVRMLDDPRNDIFLHIDSKSDISRFKQGCIKSHLYFVPRLNVLWGDFSMIRCELSLFSFARDKGPYAVYHLISGVDLPLKSQDYIHSYFDIHRDENMISILDYDSTAKEVTKRMSYYWLFPHRGKNVILHYLSCASVYVQKLLHINRNRNLKFYKGSEWCSLSDDFVCYILEHRDWIESVFKMTNCGDEIYKQTLLKMAGSKFKQCYDAFAKPSDGRFIDWTGCKSSPRVLRFNNYDALVSTDALFARKFSSADFSVIEAIERHVCQLSCKYFDKSKK